MIRTWITRTAAVATLAMIAGSANATPIDLTTPGSSTTLANVLSQPGPDAGKFIVFDKLFEITSFTPGAGSPAAFQATGITISGRNNGFDGVGFRLFSQWADNPGDNVTFGFTFAYNATVLPAYAASGVRIAGVNLAFNGASAGIGSIASVDESVFNGATLVDTARVEAHDGNPPIYSDMVALPTSLISVSVIKDFKVFAPTSTGIATTSFIEQTFKQIPAPGTGALAVMSVGLLARRRRVG